MFILYLHKYNTQNNYRIVLPEGESFTSYTEIYLCVKIKKYKKVCVFNNMYLFNFFSYFKRGSCLKNIYTL